MNATKIIADDAMCTGVGGGKGLRATLEEEIQKKVGQSGFCNVARSLMNSDWAEALCKRNALVCDFWPVSGVYEFKKGIRPYPRVKFWGATC